MASAADGLSLHSTPLPELIGGSAGFGCWTLKICGPPKDRDYTYQRDGRERTGKAFTVLLLSPDTTQYCYGKFVRRGREPRATSDYTKAKERFQDGTVWRLNKVALTKDKPLYIGSPVKAVIDLNASTATAVLQSTDFSKLLPTPAEDLATLLEAPVSQRVDVTALVANISDTRAHTTQYGPRSIVDVTIRDASGPTGASQCEFIMYFETSSKGQTALESFRKCEADNVPIAFFNLSIATSDAGKRQLKPTLEDFSWVPALSGDKAKELLAQAMVLKSTDQAAKITEIPTFVPQDAVDYVTPRATLTVARLLREVVRAHEHFPASETSHLFQLNHVLLVEPPANANILAGENQDRLFVPIAAHDHSGQVELRMREKAALALSGLPDRAAFCEEVRSAGLRFPILSSVRVLLKKNGRHHTTESGDADESATEHAISAVIVEAAEQSIEGPASIPNSSLDFLNVFFGPFGDQQS